MFTGLCSPDGGWQQNTFYLVELSLSCGNVPHKTIFYSGFLTKGEPGGYSQLYSPFYDATMHKKNLAYFKVIKSIVSENEFTRTVQ